MSTIVATPTDYFPLPAVVDQALPDCSPERRRSLFREVVEALGSHEAAEHFYYESIRDLHRGEIAGAQVPPPSRVPELKSYELGYLKLFYHPTFLNDIPQSAAFTWNLYIGVKGKGSEHIMPEWWKKGIVIEMRNMRDEWEAFTFLTIPPLTRLRISYPDPEDCKQRSMHEVVLPQDCYGKQIRTHYLEYLP